MLDVLFEVESDAGSPAAARRRLSGADRRAAQCRHRVSGAARLRNCWPINQEDLTKETAQQNLPGTTWQYPNWGRKMRFTVEQLRSDPDARNFTAMCRNWILRSGRENRSS